MYKKLVLMACGLPIQLFAQTHVLPSGWSLVGNDAGSSIETAALFGNVANPSSLSSNINTVWTWDKAKSVWNFYSPALTTDALSAYAGSKGYGVLSSIAAGEGFWVNAKSALTLQLPQVTNTQGLPSAGFANAVSPAATNIPLDISKSSLSLIGATSFKIDNVSIPNVGDVNISFVWNPISFKFEPLVADIRSNDKNCSQAIFSGNVNFSTSNSAAYNYYARVFPDGEYGAITTNSNALSPLILSWAKTTTQDQNPYLVGRTLASFDSSKRYGVLGAVSQNAYPGGFNVGDLVEIIGSPALGGFSIKRVETPATITLTLARSEELKQGAANLMTSICGSLANGMINGNINYNSFNVDYNLLVFNVAVGGINPSNKTFSPFNASWGNLISNPVFAKRNVMYGVLGVVSANAYVNFIEKNQFFLIDLGGAIAATTFDSQGVTLGTAVFTK